MVYSEAMKHTAGAIATLSGQQYIAYCDCGWCDFPRLNWTNAMRDVTYHLHNIGQCRFQCHYCKDDELGIAPETGHAPSMLRESARSINSRKW